VNAFKNSSEISISLVEGRVKVTNKEENGIKGNVLLVPNQKLVYNLNEDLSKIKDFDFQEEVGWKDNILVFRDEPLEEVFVRLERAYGIKFELQSKSHQILKITTRFDNSPLKTVSEVIKKLTGLEYRNVTDQNVITKVIFYKKKSEERRN
jgi:ferric-dicitrate binding protein FerR (iron transport regulator)